MKFTLHRKPDSKAQKIPFPAMQIAGLADAEALVLRAEEGCILLARDSLSTREIVKVIAFLDEIDTLEDFCINLEGLRSLLAMEDGRDE